MIVVHDIADQLAARIASGEKLAAIRPNSKIGSVLQVLIERGPRGLTCFDAVYECHDFVLRSTISELKRRYAILINSVPHSVPNRFGGVTRCALYTLPASEHAKAAALLGIDADDLPTYH
jgi:hypothetical protein